MVAGARARRRRQHDHADRPARAVGRSDAAARATALLVQLDPRRPPRATARATSRAGLPARRDCDAETLLRARQGRSPGDDDRRQRRRSSRSAPASTRSIADGALDLGRLLRDVRRAVRCTAAAWSAAEDDSAAPRRGDLARRSTRSCSATPNAVGKTLRIDGHDFRIVGVLDHWHPCRASTTSTHRRLRRGRAAVRAVLDRASSSKLGAQRQHELLGRRAAATRGCLDAPCDVDPVLGRARQRRRRRRATATTSTATRASSSKAGPLRARRPTCACATSWSGSTSRRSCRATSRLQTWLALRLPAACACQHDRPAARQVPARARPRSACAARSGASRKRDLPPVPGRGRRRRPRRRRARPGARLARPVGRAPAADATTPRSRSWTGRCSPPRSCSRSLSSLLAGLLADLARLPGHARAPAQVASEEHAMEFRPILSTLRRHRTAAALIVLEIALTCAIVCNALFLIGERLDRMERAERHRRGRARPRRRSPASAAQRRRRRRSPSRTSQRCARSPACESVAVDEPDPVRQLVVEQRRVDRARADADAPINAAMYIGADDLHRDARRCSSIAGRDFTPEEYVEFDGRRRANKAKIAGRSSSRRAWPSKLFPGENALGKPIVRLAATMPQTRRRRSSSTLRPAERGSGVADATYAVILPVRMPYTIGGNYAAARRPGAARRGARRGRGALDKVDPSRVILERADVRRDPRSDYFNAGSRDGVAAGRRVASRCSSSPRSASSASPSFWVQQRTRQIGMRRALGAHAQRHPALLPDRELHPHDGRHRRSAWCSRTRSTSC